VVLHEIQVMTLRFGNDDATDLWTREHAIADILPPHCQRGELPVHRSRYSGRVSVGSLMAGTAVQAHYACVTRTTHDIEQVSVTIVALLRVLDGRMAVYTAWGADNGVHAAPCREGVDSLGRLRPCLKNTAGREDADDNKQQGRAR
jgi:hypothetical protein